MTTKKQYNEFPRRSIGSSDIATLTLVGMTADHLTTEFLYFGEDGSYSAYIIGEKDVEIGAHYELVASFRRWMKIYDDDSCTASFYGDSINVYRAGDYGCIIQCIGDEGNSEWYLSPRIIRKPIFPDK